ncbi:MAG: IclR family transcriptional regulator [candidate division NC10 bacterium]|nr:IclR family transcriptional regulator [candidate division NC10 bacterium]MBI2455918.1 IclR family transcriptional regulator [candidate division NC10 bacterium]
MQRIRPNIRNMPESAHGSVASLRKGIDLLFLFSEAEPVLSLRDISSRLKLPKSTTYRFVSTLRDTGLLVQDPESRRYRLGARLLSLQPAIIRPVDLRTLAFPFLRDLMERSGETAHLTERRDSVGVITEVLESPIMLRMAPKRGQTFPLHAGALCRAILAFLPPREVDQILQSGRLKRFTPNTPTTPVALRRALRDVRKAGYAVSHQELTVGACGISAPILGPDGWAIASMGISGPMQRLTEEKRKALIEPVRRAAAEVSVLVRQQLTGTPAAAPVPRSAPGG